VTDLIGGLRRFPEAGEVFDERRFTLCLVWLFEFDDASLTYDEFII